jgi:CheY-specific phosphatase CheX
VENENFSYLINSLKDFLDDAGFASSITTVPDIVGKTNVMATIGITGEKVGFFTLSLNMENAVKVSNFFAKLMEIPINCDDFSNSHLEALSELSNQMAGRVVMYMEEMNIDCSITPPTVLSGGDISINLKTLKTTKMFRVEGEYGFFHITIGIK